MKKGRTAAADVFRQQNYVEPVAAALEEQAEQERVNVDDGLLDHSLMGAAQAPAPEMRRKRQARPAQEGAMNFESSLKTSEELQLESEPVEVRITGGMWRKRVVVPPNAYVVHTRAGQSEPVTLGLGISFKYRPATDAFLVVPAAMQTIGVVANCISQEKQGVNILAYVQWQIDDFANAYQKIDFSNKNDPLGIVNAQLREQAEAAIKDKIATMSIEEVLTDKAPVIEELTARLIEVAQGRDQGNGGMGIKIVTVQIKEAVVASPQLWDDLQRPFRHEKEKLARLSALRLQEDIDSQTMATEQATAIKRARTNAEIEAAQLAEDTRRQALRQAEELERIKLESDLERQRREQTAADELHALEETRNVKEEALQTSLRTMAIDAELAQAEAKLALQAQQQRDELQAQVEAARVERELANLELEQARLALQALQQESQQAITDNMLFAKLIEQLPELAQAMPDIDELKVVQTGSENTHSISGLVAQVMATAEAMGIKPSAQVAKAELADS